VRRLTREAQPLLCPELRLHLATPDCALWRATEAELQALGLADPYWAFCWPGGQALARFLLDTPAEVAGRRVLAFGAGGGVEAVAAGLAGAARVRAVDADPLARAACALNAERNGVQLEIDSRPGLGDDPAGWDMLLAADVCYQPELARAVVGWLQRTAGAGRRVLLSDPARGHFDPGGWTRRAELRAPADTDVAGRYWVPTAIYQCGG
jgi:predicted nicotinamide N-methyase